MRSADGGRSPRVVLGTCRQHALDRGVAQPPAAVDSLAEPRDGRAPLDLLDAAVADVGDQQPRGVGADVDDRDAHAGKPTYSGAHVSLQAMPRILLRIEGLIVFAAAVALYVEADYSLIAFVVLFLAPDLSFLGYLSGPGIGAAAYNAVHTYVLPLALGAIGVLTDAGVPVQLALIWLAHIGIDRTIGYGLKYPTAFKGSHLDRV